MAKPKEIYHLFNPFEQSARTSKRDSWETEFAPSAPVSQLVEPSRGRPTHHSPTLRALEGRSDSSYDQVSPSDAVIGIGISPSIERGKQSAPRRLIPDPVTPARFQSAWSPDPVTPQGLKSAWSPDTPSTAASLGPRASSIYSQMTSHTAASTFFDQSTAPPVPPLPLAHAPAATAATAAKDKNRILSIVEESDSPFTLFSDDDDDYEPEPVSEKRALEARYKAAESESQNWQVVKPGSKQPRQPSPQPIDDEWWENDQGHGRVPSLATRRAQDMLHVQRTPIIRVPTPKRAGSPASSMTASFHAVTPVRSREKEDEIWEEPPPYSPGAYPVNDMPKFAATLQLPVQTRATGGARVVGAATATGTRSNTNGGRAPRSPGPVSPAFVQSVTAAGDVGMSTIPLTPGPRNLPDRSFGTFIPTVHAVPTKDSAERKRRRHEKEDYWAHRVGNAWRGRGPFHQNRYFGEPGEKGRKRRRRCCWLVLLLILLIVLATGLAVGLATRRDDGAVTAPPGAAPNAEPDSPLSPTHPHKPSPTTTTTTTTTNIFVTATGFPPIPTGVLTVVGPINPVNDSSCVDPSPLWSCSLPPEDHEAVDPFEASQPTFVMQIQWDKSGRWNETDADDKKGDNDSDDKKNRDNGGILFSPNPAPPSFADMWFLGNTTDGIQGDELAGESTPFYISMLGSPDDPVGPNARKVRRASSDDGDGLPSSNLPAPDLNDDGTGAAAVLFPLATQQPLRLYDRGLPSEHYAFYTYFKRTIYVRSVEPTNGTTSPVALDLDGGSRETDAKFLVTWGSVRYRVQIFTTLPDSPSSNRTLLDDDGTINGSTELTMPGTMPLPVGVSLDLHGGSAGDKFVWHHDVTTGSRIDTTNPGLVGVDMGRVVNPAHGTVDPGLGGVDGGTGGCRCRWTNYVDPEVEDQLRRQAGSNADQTVNVPMKGN